MSLNRAVEWVKNNFNEGGGVIITSAQRSSYPEVTGYYIPTLLNLGMRKKAYEVGSWLASIQNEDGSWSLVRPGPKFTFDTAQILFGLSYLEGFLDAKFKGIKFLKSQIKESGEISSEFHANGVPSEINIWVAAIMDIYNEKEEAARIWKFYDRDETFRWDKITHFYCYILDACCYGAPEGMQKKAADAVRRLASFQKPDGSITAYENVEWVCYTGLAQAAILFYNTGLKDPGDKAINYLKKMQLDSGGFLGSNGEYFPDQEPSWAVKFYIDAYLEMIRADFDKTHEMFPWEVELGDCRCDKLLKYFKDFAGKRVLDAGCGRGRFARRLAEKVAPSIAGIDISSKMLEGCAHLIEVKEGSVLNIPYDNKSFDGVYAIEVIEHMPFGVEGAIAEMSRVLGDGGYALIIDKHREALKDSDKLSEWESWLDPKEIKDLMQKYFKEVHYRRISDLFTAWEGIK